MYVSEPIITSVLRVQGNMADADLLFSVSEIQAFGEPHHHPTRRTCPAA